MAPTTRRLRNFRLALAFFVAVAVLHAALAVDALAPGAAQVPPPAGRAGSTPPAPRPVRPVSAFVQATPAAPLRGGRPVTELKLIKVVRNEGGGSATTADWTLEATGAVADNPTNVSGVSPVDSMDQWPEFLPDVYTLAETFTGSDPVVGGSYSAGAWSCVDNQTGEPVEVTALGEVSINAGDDVTCTIVNTYTQIATPTPSPTSPGPCLPCVILGRKLYVARTGPYQGELIGLSGWQVTATLVGDEAVQATTTTDGLGQYRFTADDLAGMAFPGATIRVCEEDRPGWTHLTPSCETVSFPYPLPPGYPGAVAPDFINAQQSHPPEH